MFQFWQQLILKTKVALCMDRQKFVMLIQDFRKHLKLLILVFSPQPKKNFFNLLALIFYLQMKLKKV
jgi:hypothetical protein